MMRSGLTASTMARVMSASIRSSGVPSGQITAPSTAIVRCIGRSQACAMGLIRFGGHLPRGEYDVDHDGHAGQADAAELHG